MTNSCIVLETRALLRVSKRFNANDTPYPLNEAVPDPTFRFSMINQMRPSRFYELGLPCKGVGHPYPFTF